MNFIVTGANGFIGASLIKRFIADGNHVYAIDRDFGRTHLPNHELITKIVVDLNISEIIKERLPNVSYDAFYHLAWQGVNGPDKANPYVQLHNIEIALKCAELAKEVCCHKFLCAGTVAEQAIFSLSILKKTSGGMMYSAAKHSTRILLETYCKNIGIDFVWMQFSNIFGPENKTGNLISYTLTQLQNGSPATFGPAKQPYDFVYIDDLIEAIYRLGIKRTNLSSYYIGSGTPRILKDYLMEIGMIFGRPDLIKIGERTDDGIKYTFEMFNCSDLLGEIGNYVSMSFSDAIRYTIDRF